MIKKSFLLCMFLPLCLWLAGCSPAPASTPSTLGAANATGVFATPDQRLSTPTVGFVTVLEVQSVRGVLLRSLPNPDSAAAGDVVPGDTGRILGVDSTGSWLLVQIKNQTGWITIQLVNYSIAQ